MLIYAAHLSGEAEPVDSSMTLRESSLLSMQRALWDMVTPELRGVAMSWEESTILARFLYDLQDTAPVEQIVSEVEGFVLADHHDDVSTSFTIESVPSGRPRTLREGEWWAYLRREP